MILVACEFSGIVRDALISRGYDAISCDLLPTERPGPHIQGDVEGVLRSARWSGIIAHPPCTRLCNSGVRWLHERNLWDDLNDAAFFFKRFLEVGSDLDIPVAVENPVMHKWARKLVGAPHAFTIQPWQFGAPFKKRTCFWTRGLPPLVPTHGKPVSEPDAAVHRCPPSADRWKERSRTYPEVADAMAEQWGARLSQSVRRSSPARVSAGIRL